jgi:hypothetical protein
VPFLIIRKNTFASPSTEKILGNKVEDYVGKNIFELIHPETLQQAKIASTRFFLKKVIL